jgi:hypothetical protein
MSPITDDFCSEDQSNGIDFELTDFYLKNISFLYTQQAHATIRRDKDEREKS